MKLAVLMDPLDQIKPYKDSTVAMIKSAQGLGWSCAYFTQNDLYCCDGGAYARVHEIHIGDIESLSWVKTIDLGNKPLRDFDVILMRKDPPFDMEYIYATYALDLAEQEGVLVANKPQSLRDANEKFFTLNFPHCCPPTFVSRDARQLKEFWQIHQQVIFKPLEGMGGNSVFYVDKEGKNLSVIFGGINQRADKMYYGSALYPGYYSKRRQTYFIDQWRTRSFCFGSHSCKRRFAGKFGRRSQGRSGSYY